MRCVVSALCGALLLGTPALSAQPSATNREREEAARAELIAQAGQARGAGDHARALDLMSRAAAIRVTPSLRLFIAQEHRAVGHVTDAYDQAARCARDAQADPATPNRAEVIGVCTALLDELRARVGRVTLQVPTPPAGLRVRVAGDEVSQALWGVPYTVAPGAVVVEASADGYAPFRQSVAVAAGQSAEVRVALTELPRPAVAHAAPPPTLVTPPVVTPPTPPAPQGRSLVGPIALGAGGVVALGLSGVFFALREGAVSDRDAQCSAAGCRPAALDLDDTARTYNTLTNVSLAVGGAAVAGAVVWFLVGGRGAAERSARVSGALTPTRGGAFVSLSGSL
ncbi:MAG: hypothetical protein U0324_33935 [Polyangiales bacterium]